MHPGSDTFAVRDSLPVKPIAWITSRPKPAGVNIVHRNRGPITLWLESSPAFVLNLYAGLAAFSTYFCMYAFRKPFAAALYQDADGSALELWNTGIKLKTAFVISQIVGYALSKFLGIKFCSEMTRVRRAGALVLLVTLAQVTLLLFAVVPRDWKVLAIFLNGVPLGMVWGLVVWYLEGRRASELLLAGLSCSFIVSSAAVKDVGLWLMQDWGVSETSMPMLTGLIFILPFFISVYLLNQVPEPTPEDVAERTKREPMDAVHRISFAKHFLGGFVALTIFYFFLTAYRDYRDNYGVDVLTELGSAEVGVLSTIETCVAVVVLVILAALSLIRDNRRALVTMFVLMTLGAALMGTSTFLFRQTETIGGFTWYLLIGLGAYLAYVPYNSMLFDRIIASTHIVGTAVFAIYLADAIGYVGSILVQIYKDFLSRDSSRLEFFCGLTYVVSVLGVVCLVASCLYFAWRHGPRRRRGERRVA